MPTSFLRTALVLLLAAFVSSSCRVTPGTAPANSALTATAPAACIARFIPHPLDFVTTPRSEPIRMFDNNGAGVAVGNLGADGDLDLVFANLKGRSALLWNDGGLAFPPTAAQTALPEQAAPLNAVTHSSRRN